MLPPAGELIPYLLLVYFLIWLLFSLDSRIPVGIGISLLALAGVVLAFDVPLLLTDNLAVYAYYFLVIGVVLMVVESARKSDRSLVSVAVGWVRRRMRR